MARRKEGFISGRTGELVNYIVEGKEFVRVHVPNIKQTIATKTTARDFGIIKGLSSRLRLGLKDVLPGYKSKPVMFAMDKAVRRWYYDFYLRRHLVAMDPVYFSSLNLNQESGPFVKPILGVEPTVGWMRDKVSLHVPEMTKSEMLLPPGADTVSFTFIISGGTIDTREVEEPKSKKKKKNKEKNKVMSFGASISCDPVEKQLSNTGNHAFTIEMANPAWSCDLCLAYLSIRYKKSGEWFEMEKWKPVVVVGSHFKG